MRFYLYLLISLLVYACANPTAPTGGPTDKTPPRLDSNRYSTPNRQTNFRERDIILTFNEWVQLRDAQKQILVSPPMSTPPKISIKHKSVLVRLMDTLRSNTTYTINFGNAIADITENNALQDFKFVFSTGDKLDSLTTRGKVVDALTGLPKENVWVMLYDQLGDSIPATSRPYYCAKTNKDGLYLLENLRSDTFKIFALEDKNNDYIYNQPNESIGFWNTPFAIDDSIQPYIQLRLFMPVQQLKLQGAKSPHRNCFTLKTNRQQNAALRLEPLSGAVRPKYYIESGLDTARIWILDSLAADSTYRWLVYEGETLADTLKAKQSSTVAPALRSFVPVLAAATTTGSGSRGGGGGNSTKPTAAAPQVFHPQKPVTLAWNRPLIRIDSSLCLLVQDSVNTPLSAVFSIDSTLLTRLRITHQWKPKTNYRLTLLPGALTDKYGKTNKDTIRQNLSINSPEDYGLIIAKVVVTDSLMPYLLQLIGANEEILHRRVLQGKTTYEYNYPQLPPGSYTLRLLHDANGNGRWDEGDYWQQQQPEIITNSSPIQLRPNWENEMEIDLSKEDKGNKGRG